MTTADALIEDLAASDVHLEACGDQLNVDAPKGTLTPELADQIRDQKPELLALLSDRCWGCIKLEHQGVSVLLCSCGFTAHQPAPTPTEADLRFTLDHVRDHVAYLDDTGMAFYDEWLSLMLGAGWSHSAAERGAYARTLSDLAASPQDHST